jgi:hypothetical protein
VKVCYQCGHDLSETAHEYVRRDSGLVEPAWSLSRGGILIPAGLQELLEYERQHPSLFHAPSPAFTPLFQVGVDLGTRDGSFTTVSMSSPPLTLAGLQSTLDRWRDAHPVPLPATPEDFVLAPGVAPKRGQIIPFRPKT